MKNNPIQSAFLDILNLNLRGRLVDALSKYYRSGAWRTAPPEQAFFAKNQSDQKLLQSLRCNRCLFVEKAIGIGVGTNTSYITWVYSGTEGSVVQNTFTVTSVQFWHQGKVVREEHLHAN